MSNLAALSVTSFSFGPMLHDTGFLILTDEGDYLIIEPLPLYGHGRDGPGRQPSVPIGGTDLMDVDIKGAGVDGSRKTDVKEPSECGNVIICEPRVGKTAIAKGYSYRSYKFEDVFILN
nr:probable polygalacturonase [Tanacetum cinerariifolium]